MKKLSLLVALVSFFAISCSTPGGDSTVSQDSTVVDTTVVEATVAVDSTLEVAADSLPQDTTK